MSGRAGQPDQDRFAEERKRMVRTQLRARGIRDPATLASMGLVPREAFVPLGQRERAYADGALGIGREQTISQPYMVAVMTQALGFADLGWPWIAERPSFLDVGTGSGYQAAVLAQLGAHVVSVERDPYLAEAARERLGTLGYDVEVVEGDGTLGMPEHGPYAGIVVAAAAPHVPQPLVEQLADGARLVIPVGSRSTQRIMVVRRQGTDTVTSTSESCVFVPLVGQHGHPD